MTGIIRRAEIIDAEQMANIHARSWESAYINIIPESTISETSSRRPALWKRILSEADGSFKFAICDSEKVIGLLVLGESRDKDINTSTLEVISLYLLPEFFGKGYGKLAMDFTIKFAQENKYSRISLWVLEENQRARHFYKKCGYSFDGTKKEVFIGKPMIELRYCICL